MNEVTEYKVSRESQRAGGYATMARYGRDAVAGRARQGRWQKFLRDVDPEGVLPMAERIRRAEDLQRSTMILLGQKSAKARKQRKQAAENARIRAIAQPPTACGNHGPLARGVSHRTCDECSGK